MRDLINTIRRVYGIPASEASRITVEWATARLAKDIGLEEANKQREQLNEQRVRVGQMPADHVGYVFED